MRHRDFYRPIRLFCCGAPKTLAIDCGLPILEPCCTAAKPNSGSRKMQSTFLSSLIGDLDMLTAEQLLAAQKANLATLFELGQKAFEGVEKVMELNLQVAKTSLEEASEHTKAVLAIKDAQELLALQASLLQPAAEKAAAYGRHLYDIASGTSAEVSKLAESQLAEAQNKFASVVDNAVKNPPRRHRERRCAGQVGCRRCQQRFRVGAKGRQAS